MKIFVWWAGKTLMWCNFDFFFYCIMTELVRLCMDFNHE